MQEHSEEKKTDYFYNIDIKTITDNKRFWTAVKPLFTVKSKTCNNIILNENDKTIKDGKKIAILLHKYFADIIKKLNLKKDTGTSFESHENCRMIKTKFEKEDFSFEVFTIDAVAIAIKNLMKETIDAYCPKLTQIMNDCLKKNGEKG